MRFLSLSDPVKVWLHGDDLYAEEEKQDKDYEDGEGEDAEEHLESLLRYYPEARLLPNLCQFGADAPSQTRFCSHFCGPTLRWLTVHYDDSTSFMSFPGDVARCTSLRVFELNYKSYHHNRPQLQRVTSSVSLAVSSLNNLAQLKVGRLLPNALEHLASLPNLRLLNFKAYDHVEYCRPTPCTFKSLEHLSITIRLVDISPVPDFLTHFPAPQLTHFTLLYHATTTYNSTYTSHCLLPAASHLHRLFALLASVPGSGSTLGRLAVELPGGVNYRYGEECLLTSAHLAPLHALSILEHLDLSKLPCRVEPAGTHKMALAWPKIRTLELGEAHAFSPGELHVADLIPFANHCPDLHKLGLSVLMPETPSSAESPMTTTTTATRRRYPRLRHTLYALYVNGKLPLAFSEDVAEFLACVFPEARVVATARPASAASKGAVERIVKRRAELVQKMEGATKGKRDKGQGGDKSSRYAYC